jgi:predicted aspartyl protease
MRCWTREPVSRAGRRGGRRAWVQLGWLTVAAALAGCATVIGPAPRKTTLAADRVSLPTTREPEFAGLFVEARINGHGPFRLLVDTGASCLVIAPRAAAAAGLKALPGVTVTAIGASGKAQTGEVAFVDRLEAGGFKAEQLVAYLMQPADADNFERYLRVDGLCGIGVFADVVLEMDFPGGQVSALRPGVEHYPAERAVAHDAGMVTVNLAGKSARARIDTGFEGTFQLPLDQTTLRYPRVQRDWEFVSLGSVAKTETSQFDGDIALGPISWRNPPVSVSDGHPLIGSRALQPWKLVVDQRANKFYFLGGDPQQAWPDHRLRAGRAGYVADYEGPRLRIRRVFAGSPAAAAGLRVGDAVVSINGVAAADFVTGHAADSERAGSVRLFRVVREGGELDLTLKVPEPLTN